MSYLLDALRKAERERHLERVPDLAQLHEPDVESGHRGLPGWVAPVVAALVLVNLGVLSAFWLLRDNGAPAPPVSVPNVEKRPLQPAMSAPEPSTETAFARPRPTAPETPLAAPGSVTDLSADIQARLPPIEVSGHLYSSIPGRSFVLVNGRRYREGERLREGPAVESIDETGAVLNYRGERFRVAAPR